jgi:hypothetical protein
MNNLSKWRIAHLGGSRVAYHECVSSFKRAYEASSKPEGMAMFSHSDTGTGRLMTVSITPQAVPYCPFSTAWEEMNEPQPLGNVEWVAGDVRLKPVVSELTIQTH